jgi:5-methylcytosine-specific restriction endonuclease McrA
MSGFRRYGRYKSEKYKNWRLQVFKRDNFTCQRCSQKGSYLNAHHVKPWGLYPSHRYNIDNGITLCYRCHTYVHKTLDREYITISKKIRHKLQLRKRKKGWKRKER